MPSSQAHLQLQKTLASPKVQIPQTGLRSLHSSSRSKTSLLFALLTSLNIPRWRPALLPSCPPVLSRSFFPFIPPSPPLRPEFPRPLAEERGKKKKKISSRTPAQIPRDTRCYPLHWSSRATPPLPASTTSNAERSGSTQDPSQRPQVPWQVLDHLHEGPSRSDLI